MARLLSRGVNFVAMILKGLGVEYAILLVAALVHGVSDMSASGACHTSCGAREDPYFCRPTASELSECAA